MERERDDLVGRLRSNMSEFASDSIRLTIEVAEQRRLAADRIESLEARLAVLEEAWEQMPSWGEAEEFIAWLQRFPTHREQRAAGWIRKASDARAAAERRQQQEQK